MAEACYDREMARTLLQVAQEHRGATGQRRSYRYGPQTEELALAWFRGEITFGQASAATGLRGTSLYGLLAVSLREAAVAGRITMRVGEPLSPNSSPKLSRAMGEQDLSD
jgi:hypothetical protein